MNQQQHKTTKMDSQPKNDEKKDDKTNEDTEWKNHMLDAMRELKNEMQDLRSEIVAQRRAINDNDVKLEEKVEELRSTLCDSVMNVRESIQTVSDALGDHVHQSEGKNCELRSSIVQVENRITSSFERLSNEIKACRDTQEAYKEELLGNIERLDQERYEDLGAVEDMAGHIPEIEERLTELQRLREAVPPISFIESRLDRLEGRVQTLDMAQRDTAHSLVATGRHVEAWEEALTLRFKFRLPFGRSFELLRTQFPLRLAYCMTINKSQGQELQHCCLDLRSPPFSHGHLYVEYGVCMILQYLQTKKILKMGLL